MQVKVETELRNAVKKFGPVKLAETYEEIFARKILEKRNQIAEKENEKYSNSLVQEQK